MPSAVLRRSGYYSSFSAALSRPEPDIEINPMGRYYRLDEGRHVVAYYDKKPLELWILAQSSTYEREDDWNHWKIFSRRAIKVELVRSYWWWGVWNPRQSEPYWSEPDMSKEHMVHCLYVEATGDESDSLREIMRSFRPWDLHATRS